MDYSCLPELLQMVHEIVGISFHVNAVSFSFITGSFVRCHTADPFSLIPPQLGQLLVLSLPSGCNGQVLFHAYHCLWPSWGDRAVSADNEQQLNLMRRACRAHVAKIIAWEKLWTTGDRSLHSPSVPLDKELWPRLPFAKSANIAADTATAGGCLLNRASRDENRRNAHWIPRRKSGKVLEKKH